MTRAEEYLSSMRRSKHADSHGKDGPDELVVTHIQRHPVDDTAPTTGQAYVWDGSSFAPVGIVADTDTAGGVLDGTYPNPGLAASVAGDGLAETTNVLSVNTDDSTIEKSSDALRVKDAGVTKAKLNDDIIDSRVGVAVTRTTNTNINHLAELTVSFENTEHNSGEGFWAVGTPTVFTVPSGMDGLYAISIGYLFTAGGSYAAFMNFSVRDFGHTILGSGLLQSENGTSAFVVWLAAGDTFTVRFINASGAARTLDTCWFQMNRILSL